MKDPTAMGWPQSVALQGDLELSKLVAQTRLHTGLLWAVALAVALWALLSYTCWASTFAPSAPTRGPPPSRRAGHRARWCWWRCCRAHWRAWPARSRWPAAPAM